MNNMYEDQAEKLLPGENRATFIKGQENPVKVTEGERRWAACSISKEHGVLVGFRGSDWQGAALAQLLEHITSGRVDGLDRMLETFASIGGVVSRDSGGFILWGGTMTVGGVWRDGWTCHT